MKKLSEDIKSGKFNNIYLLYGNESYLLRQWRDNLAEAMVPKDLDINITRINGRELDPVSFKDTVDSLPFLWERRVVVVENGEFFMRKGKGTSKNEKILEAISGMPDTTHVIFVEKLEKPEGGAKPKTPDTVTKLYKFINENGYVCKLDTPEERILEIWCKSLFKAEGKQISDDHIRYILKNTETDMDHIYNEVNKLLSYTAESSEITKKDIDAICSFKLDDRIFEMIELIAKGDRKNALNMYNDQLKLGGNYRGMLTLIIRKLTQIYTVKELEMKGMKPSKISEATGMKSWLVEKNLKSAKGFTLDQVRTRIEKGLEVIERITGGTMAEAIAMDEFICYMIG